MAQSFGSTLAILLVFAAVICAAIYFFMKHRKLKEEQMTFEQLQSIVYEEIQDVCELALVREKFSEEILIDEHKKIPLLNVQVPGTSRKLKITYSGTIVCGFDLNDKENTREELIGDKVKIFIPQSKILDIYADMKTVRVYEEETGIFVKHFKPEEQNALIAAKVEEYGQQEIQQGLLLRADENARKMLMSRLMNRGLNGSFDFEILTLNNGNVRQLNPPQ